MEKDRVKFYMKNGEVLAYFPDMEFSEGYKTCYAHIGQHSACHPGGDFNYWYDYVTGVELIEWSKQLPSLIAKAQEEINILTLNAEEINSIVSIP